MEQLIASAQLVFEGSADTQIFLVSEEEQKFLISFSGFLDSTNQSLEGFRCSEIIIYTGENIPRIKKTMMKRSEDDETTEHHSFRRFTLNHNRKHLMVQWLFLADDLMVLD